LTNRAVYSFSLKKNIEFTIPWKTITAVSKEKSLIGGSVVFEFQDGGKGGAKKLFCLSKAVMEYVFNLSNQMRQDLGRQ
ncbi:MAG: hypothetical protein FWG66_13005, partial [Spirochaetes bacterium]|nr:hypothetical protein [Spirochaetota bacterium]